MLALGASTRNQPARGRLSTLRRGIEVIIYLSPKIPMAKNHKNKKQKPAKSKVAKPALKKKPSAPIKAKAAKPAPPTKSVKVAKRSPTMEKPSKKNALRNSII